MSMKVSRGFIGGCVRSCHVVPMCGTTGEHQGRLASLALASGAKALGY